MKRLVSAITISVVLISLAVAQSNKQAGAKSDNKNSGAKVQPSAANPVAGSGTPGRISKWLGVFGTSTFTIGDSNITEDKFGKVGVNTAIPTSPLTVRGMIETTLDGLKFPDGTIQTTAAVTGLQTVFHDGSLQGDGRSGSPLGVAIPLTLFGSAPTGSLLNVLNNSDGGTGLFVSANNSSSGIAGTGIDAVGGGSATNSGAAGVNAHGGPSGIGGGEGVIATGGEAFPSGMGGTGLNANGGTGHGQGNSGGSAILAVAGQGLGGATKGLAGEFDGDVKVTGNLSKAGGSFKIDHPLDPENKYLYHSFVESPDMKNIYDGTVTSDPNGDALVTLPDYFEALNRDFRYQLTVIGTFAQAIVSNEIENNHFRIKTSIPNVKVSWQVTGIRRDAYANKHRIQVEEAKPGSERGTYLHPDAFDQPEEKNVLFVQYPQVMQQLKETRDKRQNK